MAMRTPKIEAITTALGDKLSEWFDVADRSFDEEATQEIEGIVLAVNDTSMLFEIGSPTVSHGSTSGCSGVLWAKEDGTVIHGRNMDYSSPFDMIDKETGKIRKLDLDDVTFEVVFKRNGKPLFLSTMWPGSVGIHTAMRFNGWSFEQNTRLGFTDPPQNLEAGKLGGGHFGIVARRIMESTDSFEEALQALYNYSFMAPQYFVMSGKGAYEGAILTIDRLGEHKKNP